MLTTAAHAQPSEWQWTPTNASGVMLGQATINGVPAEAADWIGAFDPAGNCAGAAPIIVNEGLAYFNLPIYGDDAGTADLDEGITAGEPFTLRIWQVASNSFATYPNDDAPEYLDGWSNTNGAPIPDYSDPSVVYDFALEVNRCWLGTGCDHKSSRLWHRLTGGIYPAVETIDHPDEPN